MRMPERLEENYNLLLIFILGLILLGLGFWYTTDLAELSQSLKGSDKIKPV